MSLGLAFATVKSAVMSFVMLATGRRSWALRASKTSCVAPFMTTYARASTSGVAAAAGADRARNARKTVRGRITGATEYRAIRRATSGRLGAREDRSRG